MIEKMLKVYCVSRRADKDRLVSRIRDLGVIHLEPVDPERAVASEEILAGIDRRERVRQILSPLAAEGVPQAAAASGEGLVREVLEIERRRAEAGSRLAHLHRRLEEIAPWGDVRLEQLEAIERGGLSLRFFRMAESAVATVQAECVQVVSPPGQGTVIAAVVTREGVEPVFVEPVEEVPLPETDRASILEQVKSTQASMREDAARLARLAHGLPLLEKELDELRLRAEHAVAVGGALASGELFALQGWVPAMRSAELERGLADSEFPAAARTFEPEEGELPPTLITYPRWARPIKGLFDILGTVPGYREADVSGFFMIAMPLFAAILIGDGGYGLVFLLAGLLLRRKARGSAAEPKVNLLIIIGAATLLWGVLTGGLFGLGPVDFCKAGGGWEKVGLALNRLTVVGVETEALERAVEAGSVEQLEKLSRDFMDELRVYLMKLSFIIAVLHLVSARLREALGFFPDQRALASVGWAVLLCGMFGVVWYLFFAGQDGGEAAPLSPVVLVLIAVGGALAIGFGAPSRNPVKRLGIGLAAFLLPAMGTFSDTMSYIRLMAVSLASVYIAQVFNMLGGQLGDATVWPLAIPVYVLGHALNIGLCMIAIFAHGVRLNMLEFSNNAGVQWAGYPFQPLAKR
ncbi:MAG: hypothetical protein JXA90_02465 [Planctomycetes bacterium]|nr:hypothetical protein [Planctomycetota bacterium]